VCDYSIVLYFDDGKQQLINFKPFLIKSRHPDIRRWLDIDKFSTFRIEYGELVWGIMNYVSLFVIYILTN
jgi:hypothetical protein